MKKIYQTPATIVVNVEPQLMAGASQTKNINPDAPALTSEESVAARRGGSFWDDED